MKKKYETPYLAAESFQLNAAVAGGCSDAKSIVINHSESTCGYGTGYNGMTFQFFNTDNCTVDLVGYGGGDDNDTLCYHGPWSASTTFTYS